ncbi:hypothetical protein [Bradyrhizobium sp. 5.13L]
MTSNRKPIELRLKRLEEATAAKPRKRSRLAWLADFADPARAVSLAALVITLATTIYTWRKDAIQSQEARRREFDSAIEQLIETALKNYEYVKNNKGEQNFGAMNSWFSSQTLIMRDKAANSMLGLDGVSVGQYLLVGNAMMTGGQPNRASELFKKAVEVAQYQRDKNVSYVDRAKFLLGFGVPPEPATFDVASVSELASAYISLGASLYFANRPGEAAQQYESAKAVYRNSNNYPEAGKNEAYAFIHKFWAETLAQKGECAQSKDHFQTAQDLFPPGRKNPQDTDWASLQYGLNWATQCMSFPQALPPAGNPLPTSPSMPK